MIYKGVIFVGDNCCNNYYFSKVLCRKKACFYYRDDQHFYRQCLEHYFSNKEMLRRDMVLVDCGKCAKVVHYAISFNWLCGLHYYEWLVENS